MKIRYGFVSNSSTTSFCIYGVSMERDDLKEALGKTEDEYFDPIGEIGAAGLVAYSQAYTGEYYIGRSWADVKDDQTGKDFKNETEDLLVKLLKKDVKCKTIEEGWYDG